jgi:hypothetical protein
MMKNIIIEKIELVEQCLEDIERIISQDMTNQEYDENIHIQNIHKKVLEAFLHLRKK